MTREVLEQACALIGLDAPRPRLEVSGQAAMREAVAAGLGIGVIFEQEAQGDSRLSVIPFADAPIESGVYVVCLRESLDIPAISALMTVAGYAADRATP